VSGRGRRRPLALTPGEPAGIGPDISIEAWLARRTHAVPPFVLLAQPALVRERAAAMGRTIRADAVTIVEAAEAFGEVLPCLSSVAGLSGAAGRIDAASAPAVIDAIRRAVELVHAGEAAAVVTNPIQKSALMAAGFGFPGHTEFLGSLAVDLYGTPSRPVMMLVAPMLRVVPVTVHIPLAEVPRRLTTELIIETGIVAAEALASRFGVARPRLAVAGLNPHAGEDGMLGEEDEAIVRPAVDALRAAGVDATGPFPADTMFHAEARTGYDAALCMYHDQALVPLKTLAFDEGVNVTLGLPFVRTSPDHGTAFALAGTGRAKATSLIAALKLAAALAGDEAGA
jgi:4-hydroxythreonine-4-phosphate dehydrogenase